jgi:transcriptional regulator with XRE-family HTH domain
MARNLTRAQVKVRMLRALSGISQEEFERATEVPNIAGMENGSRHPTAAQIARMCQFLDITPEDCEKLLQDYETRVAQHRAEGGRPGTEPPFMVPGSIPSIARLLEEAEMRLGLVSEEKVAIRAAERRAAKGPWERLRNLGSFDEMVLVARSAKELQTWAVVELICQESTNASTLEPELARNLSELAVEIAGRIRAPESWRLRVRGFAMAHLAFALHCEEKEEPAREMMDEAQRLWEAGLDPEQILDEGKFLDLESSINTSNVPSDR